jgi:hypothetical protein
MDLLDQYEILEIPEIEKWNSLSELKLITRVENMLFTVRLQGERNT